MGMSPELKEREPISLKEFCEKISSSKIRECIGFGGMAAILPHRLPEELPSNWPELSKDKPNSINPEQIEQIEGYAKEAREDEEDEYDTVYPIPGVKGLVLVGNNFFVKFGEGGKLAPVVFKEDGRAMELKVNNDGSIEEGEEIALKWDAEKGEYVIG